MLRRLVPFSLTVMIVLVACGSFSGQDVDPGGGAQSDAASDAPAMTSDGGPLGIPTTDAGGNVDGTTDAGAGCENLVNESFDGKGLPSMWMPMGTTSGVAQDNTHTVSGTEALHALVTGGTVKDEAYLSRSWQFASPSSVTAGYSVYLSDWQKTTVISGCSVVIGQGATAVATVRLTHQPDGQFDVTASSSATVQQPVSGLYTVAGFYGVQVAIKTTVGVLDVAFDITRPDGTHAGGVAKVASGSLASTTFIELDCGLPAVDFSQAVLEKLETWVDNVTLTACH